MPSQMTYRCSEMGHRAAVFGQSSHSKLNSCKEQFQNKQEKQKLWTQEKEQHSKCINVGTLKQDQVKSKAGTRDMDHTLL